MSFVIQKCACNLEVFLAQIAMFRYLGDSSNEGRDKVYRTNGTPQQIVWAIGPLNSKDEAAKHYNPPLGRISGWFKSSC